MQLSFDEWVKKATRYYHLINWVFYILSVIGGFNIGYTYAQVVEEATEYYVRTRTDYSIMFPIVAGIVVMSTLIFTTIRAVVKIYGESLRSNLYTQSMINQQNRN